MRHRGWTARWLVAGDEAARVVKVPEGLWPEFWMRVLTCAQARSRAIAAALALLSSEVTVAAPDTAPDFGTATVANQSYALGTKITDLELPAATGGNGTLVYALSPDPPAGLSFDAGTRTLSGTPSAGHAATTYTYKVTDADSNTAASDADSLTFTIEVQFGCAGSTAVGGSSVTSGALVEDCEALLASEATLVGTGTALDWDTATAMTGWTGVGVSNGRVNALALNGHGLAGSVPAELGDLSGLKVLYLDGNSLTGSIPAKLGALSGLTSLRLDDNSLSGSIPAELGALSGLKVLQLDDNSLTGSIPAELGALSGLTSLRLDDNSLTGSIPAELGDLPSLVAFRLSGNSLEGCIPVALRRHAETINPQKNNVDLPECPGVPVLTLTPGDEEIAASWSVPAGGTPTGYDVEYKLSSASDWTDAEYTGTDTTATIGSLTNGSEYEVRVRARTATDTGGWSAVATAMPVPNVVPDFGTATVANQSYALGTKITDLELPAATGGNGTLVYALSPDPPAGLSFDAGTRTLSGTPSAGHAATTYTYKVTDADSNTAASDADSLTFTIEVQFGCAGSTAVGGSSVTSGALVEDCEALLASEATLVGTGTALDWDTATAMTGWTGVGVSNGRVNALALNGHGLAGSVPAELGDLSGLKVLYLDGNSLTGSIPAKLGDLSGLTFLQLDDNSLSGSIPAELGALSGLTSLRLDDNSLTGSIPVELGNLSSLNFLQLQRNSLEGCIPVALRRHAKTINPQKNNVDLPECPGVPVLTLTPGDGEIAASWSVPAGGTPTGYDVEYKLSSASDWTDAEYTGTDTTATIGSLTNGSEYEVRVRARTATDTGGWSAVATATLGASTAPAFENDTETREVTENHADAASVGAAVSATDVDGDALRYSLTSLVDPNDAGTGEGTDHESFTIGASDGQLAVRTGVTLDHESKSSYAVLVQVSDGEDDDGNAEDTATIDDTVVVTITVTNVEEPPGAPAGLTVDSVTATSLTVSWTAPSDSGAVGVTDYDVRWFKGENDPGNGADWVEAGEDGGHDHAGTATTATIPGLEAGTAYRVQVRAEGDGEGAWSASVGGATVESTPVVTAVAVDAQDAKTLTLTFDKDLEVPDAQARRDLRFAFSVQGFYYQGVPIWNQSPNRVAVGGPTVTLTFGTEALPGRTFTVSYDEAAAGLGTSLQDTAGNKVAGFTYTAQRPATGSTPPVLTAAHVAGTALTLIFDRALDAGSAPAGRRFRVLCENETCGWIWGTGRATVSGKKVTVTLTSAVPQDERVYVFYAKGDDASPLRSASSGPKVTDIQMFSATMLGTTPPALVEGSVAGTSVTLYYDKTLDTDSTPATGDFTLTAASSAQTVSDVSMSETAVTLTLASAVSVGQTVTVSYTAGTNRFATRPATARRTSRTRRWSTGVPATRARRRWRQRTRRWWTGRC